MHSLMETDVLVAEQCGLLAGVTLHQPERRLMLAVLEDAIQTVMRHAGDRRPRYRKLVRDVDRWLDARNPDSLFAFAHVCDVLGLDAPTIRKGVRQMMGRLEDGAAVRSRLALSRRMAGERHRVGLSRAQRQLAAEL